MTKIDDNFNLYLEERFKGITSLMNNHFYSINNMLEDIKVQTTKTNNKVIHLEEAVIELEKKEIAHVVDCPNIIKINAINDELLEYKVFKKYPKVGVALIAITVVLLTISIFNFELSFKNKNASEPVKTENVQE